MKSLSFRFLEGKDTGMSTQETSSEATKIVSFDRCLCWSFWGIIAFFTMFITCIWVALIASGDFNHNKLPRLLAGYNTCDFFPISESYLTNMVNGKTRISPRLYSLIIRFPVEGSNDTWYGNVFPRENKTFSHQKGASGWIHSHHYRQKRCEYYRHSRGNVFERSKKYKFNFYLLSAMLSLTLGLVCVFGTLGWFTSAWSHKNIEESELNKVKISFPKEEPNLYSSDNLDGFDPISF